MKAAIFVGQDQPLAIEDVEPMPPGPGDVVVSVGASGVCHSDLSVMNGTSRSRRPSILGHEGTGIVEEVGAEVTGVQKGDRVIAVVHARVRHVLVLPARPVEPLRARRSTSMITPRAQARRRHDQSSPSPVSARSPR